MPKLVVQNGHGSEEIHELDGDVSTIGRHPTSTVILNDSTVSSHHGEIVFSADGVRVLDLNSVNGTSLNGQPIVEASIKHGDRITFGGLQTTFYADEYGSEMISPTLEVQTPQAKHRNGFATKAFFIVLVLSVVAGIIVFAMHHYTSRRGGSQPAHAASRTTVNTSADTIVSPTGHISGEEAAIPNTDAATSKTVDLHSGAERGTNGILKLETFPDTLLAIDKRLIQSIPTNKSI